MLSVSHALTGAFIATKIKNPLLYIPLVLVSHYFEDWVLHWDVGTGLSKGTRKKSDAVLLELIDLAIAGIFLFLLFQQGTQGVQIDAYVGAFTGLLPDFVEAPRNFFHFNPWWLKPFNDFHHWFHHSTPDMLVGLFPQFIVLALILVLR